MGDTKKAVKPEDQIKALEERVAELTGITEEQNEALAIKSKEVAELTAKVESLEKAKEIAEANATVVPSKVYKAANGGEYRFKNSRSNFKVPRMGDFTVAEALEDDAAMAALINLDSGLLEIINEPKK